MSVALRAITRLQDADDINVSLGVGEDGKTLVYDHDTARFVLAAAAGGGVTDHGALTGLSDDDHTQYLLDTGARTGASSQAQTFTNGIVGPTWKPASDSTTALQMTTSGGAAILTVDTTNRKAVLNTTSTAAALGAELIANGDFAASGTWTYGTGWAWDSGTGTAKHTVGSTDALSQAITLIAGGVYQIEFQIKTRTAGYVDVNLGGAWNAVHYDSTDTFAPLMVASAPGSLEFFPSSTFDGSIDNVSVKRVTVTNPVMGFGLDGTPNAEVRNLSNGFGFGLNSLKHLSTDSWGGNFALGAEAGGHLTTGWSNVAVGDSALAKATTVSYDVAIGFNALGSTEYGANSIAIGAGALAKSKCSWNNVAIGGGALANLDGRNPDGNAGNNVAIGSNALPNLTIGYGNTAIGPYNELGALTTGVSNIAIGSRNSSITTGDGNILVGSVAGYALQTGHNNVMIGSYSGFGVTGSNGGNVSVGGFATGRANGSDNVVLGHFAGYGSWAIAGMNRSTIIGKDAGYTAYSSDSVFLGHKAGYFETGDSKLFIDNQSRTNEANSRVSSLVYGEFNNAVGSQLFRVNGVLQSLMSDAATGAVTTQMRISHNTSGTVANGFGSRVLWELESSTTADQTAAGIHVLWNDATHASRKADLVLTAYDSGGEREGLRIRGDGSGPALGFYGVAPIARAVLATGAGATVDNVITALQNLGLVKQS